MLGGHPLGRRNRGVSVFQQHLSDIRVDDALVLDNLDERVSRSEPFQESAELAEIALFLCDRGYINAGNYECVIPKFVDNHA